MKSPRLLGKRVLVTGGLGFIGGALVHALAPRNDVTVVDTSNAKSSIPGITFVRGDITSPEVLATAAKDIDVVFHFGSPSSMELFSPDPTLAASSTVLGFLNVLEYSANHGVDYVVYPSSGTVYGDSAGTTRRRLAPLNIYGSLKLFHEHLASTYSDRVKVRGLRIFMGYGPGEETKGPIGSPVYLFIRDILNGKRPLVWGDGTQSRDLVFIADIVDAAIGMCRTRVPADVIDVGTGVMTSFNDVIELISDSLGMRIRPTYVEVPRSYQMKTRASPDAMVRLIDRAPTTAVEGIDRFCSYLRALSNAPATGRKR